MKARSLVLLLALLAVASPLAGCNKHDRTTHADTEGQYLDVGSLKYQIQISRELNPSDAEDRTYLEGLSPQDRTLGKDESWFGIFMFVQNESGHAAMSSDDFSIRDTQDTVYTPVTLGPINPFAYHSALVPDKGQIPAPDTVAQQTSIGGSLVLFKVKLPSYDNRPLELTIKDPGGAQPGTIDLDV